MSVHTVLTSRHLNMLLRELGRFLNLMEPHPRESSEQTANHHEHIDHCRPKREIKFQRICRMLQDTNSSITLL